MGKDGVASGMIITGIVIPLDVALLVLMMVLAAAGGAVGAKVWLQAPMDLRKSSQDPLKPLFERDTLARAVAQVSFDCVHPAPHAMLAALRRVWKHEAAATATKRAASQAESAIMLPAPDTAKRSRAG